MSSVRSVSSAPATSSAVRRSNHCLPWFASIEAFAAILVPSIATVPNRPNPTPAAIINTCENKSVNTSRASARNLAIVT